MHTEYGVHIARLPHLRGNGHTRRHNADRDLWASAIEWSRACAPIREDADCIMAGLSQADALVWRNDSQLSSAGRDALHRQEEGGEALAPAEQALARAARSRQGLDNLRSVCALS